MMLARSSWLALVILTLGTFSRGEEKPPVAKPSPEAIEFFEKKIRPGLVKHCYSCHSAEAKKLKGSLALDTREGVLKGGVSGRTIVPRKPEESLLIEAVRGKGPFPQMPPNAKLNQEAIADLEAWVKMGAPDPRDGGTGAKKIDFERAKEFWSFKPVVRPEVPKHNLSNPLDNFIQAQLEAKGLKPAPPTDRRTLLRSATYDLTGLPPSPEEIDAFLKDTTPEAFANVVERLLASPAYGERWGRHWLDVLRYADTAGDNSDYPIPQMYRYRNWVIDAFNRDLPYDEFIRQQIAGELSMKAEGGRRRKTGSDGFSCPPSALRLPPSVH